VLWRLRRPVLALGGGGARGFAHLGVLDVLDEQHLPVRAIAGTSMGAVVGAMYLSYGSAAAAIAKWREAIEGRLVPAVRPLSRQPRERTREHPLLQAARRIRDQVVIAVAVRRPTILDGADLMRALEFLIPDTTVEQLPRPFVVVATDFELGTEVRLTRGDLRTVLRASSAIPGIVPAVAVDGRTLVDGGVVADVPVAAARSLGRPVVAVNVAMEIPPAGGDDLVLDTLMRAQMMTGRLLREHQLRNAAGVILPRVGYATWADWNRFEELVDVGRAAAREFLGLPRAREIPLTAEQGARTAPGGGSAPADTTAAIAPKPPAAR
jgi:NTE family protein